MTSLAPHSAAAPIRRAGTAILVCGGLVVLGAMIAVRPVPAVALALAGVATVAAFWRPVAVAGAAIVLMAVVPVYAAPPAGPLSTHPTVLLSWLVAIVLGIQFGTGRLKLRLTVIDVAMALVFVGYFLSVAFGIRAPADFIRIVETALGPFFAIRLVAAREGPGWLPRMFAIAAVVSLPIVLVEVGTGTNPLQSLNFNAGEAAAFGGAQERLGLLRAEGAFGQAISLSQFAATAMLLSLAMAALAGPGRTRFAWSSIFVIGAIQIALSGSRTGWIVLALGIVLLAMFVTTGAARWRLLSAALAAGVVVVILLAVTGQLETLLTLFGGAGGADIDASDRYRQILLERALGGEGISWFGETASTLGAGIDTGSRSIDNAYLAIAADWGWVGMGTFMAVGASLLVALWHGRGTLIAAVPAVALANFAGLITVAINAQTSYWLWMLIAAAAAGLDRAVPAHRGP